MTGSQVWDINTGRTIISLNDQAQFNDLSLSHDRKLLGGFESNNMIIRDIENGEIVSGPLVNSHASLESITTIAFSHDKSFIASGYDDGSIKIWDITQHHLISKGANPSQVRFIEDGRIVLCWENMLSGHGTKIMSPT